MKPLNVYIACFVIACLSFFLAACGDKKEPSAEASTQEAKPVAGTIVATGIDAHPGKILHDSNCISCHDAKVYTRVDRKVLDFTQLAAQVRRCDANLGSRLFDEDLAQITDYLNQAYYKYPKQ